MGRAASHAPTGIASSWTRTPIDRRFARARSTSDAQHVESFRVRSLRIHRRRPIIGFDGVDTIDAAEGLAAAEIRIPPRDLMPLPGGTFYRHDLVGCAVETLAGLQVGVVSAVEGSEEGSRLIVGEGRAEVLGALAARSA
jgi:ribosomal 30S subunit maturation factor RimM